MKQNTETKPGSEVRERETACCHHKSAKYYEVSNFTDGAREGDETHSRLGGGVQSKYNYDWIFDYQGGDEEIGAISSWK